MRSTTRIAGIALAAAMVVSCQDAQSPTAVPLGLPGPTFEIRDGAHGGIPQFRFLPPMVPATTASGAFDATASPTVEILDCGTDASCASHSLHAEYSMDTGLGSEIVRRDTDAGHYIVNWHTDRTGAKAGNIYRIVVLLDGMRLGHSDIHLAANQKEAKNVHAGSYVALVDGRTLPIKFRIERGLASAARAAITATPAEIVADGVEQSTVSVQLRDADGNALMSGTGYAVQLSTNVGTLSAVTAGAGATFSATLTSTTAGTATITGTLNGAPIAGQAVVALTDPVPAPVPAALSIVTQPSPNAQNGIAFGTQPVIRIVDQRGDPFAKAGVIITAALTASPAGATLGGTASATTDGAGRATFSGLSIAGKMGDYTLTFSAGGLVGAVSDTIAVPAGSAAKMEIVTGHGQTGTVRQKVTVNPCIRLTDAHDDPAKRVFVNFTPSPGSGFVNGAEGAIVLLDENGFACLTSWILGTEAGLMSMTVSEPGGLSVTLSATAVPDVATRFIVSCTEGCTADNKVTEGTTMTLSAQAVDQYDNSVATDGLEVTWSVGADVLGTSKTSSAGTAAVQLEVGASAGTTFTVKAAADTVTGGSPQFTVQGGGGGSPPGSGCRRICRPPDAHV